MSRLCRVTFVLGYLLAFSAAAQPSEWSPELGPAFEAYFADDWVETQQRCARVLDAARSEPVRRDAEALHSLATMRQGSRADRIFGRARLQDLIARTPALARRSECLLALGVCQLELGETADSLRNLSAAASGFEREARPARAIAALRVLADAWVRHGEWELTPAELLPRRPADPAAARAIRIEKLSEIAARLQSLAAPVDELVRLEVAQARVLLEAGETARATESLERIVARTPSTPATVAAGLELADFYENSGRAADALRLLDQVAAARVGDASDVAAQRAKGYHATRLELIAPARIAPGERFSPTFRARNCKTLRFEVRAVDLASFVTQRRGQLAPAALPIDGPAMHVADVTLDAQNPLEWSHGTDAANIELPSGAYVLWARGAGPRGETVDVRQLLLATRLEAAALLGPRQALFAAVRENTPAGNTSLEFWVRGAFVPQRTELANGLGSVAYRGEARLLRDKRWLALLQDGDDLALLSGELPVEPGAREDEAALLAVVDETESGRAVHALARLLRSSDADGQWEVEWSDGTGRTLKREAATPHGNWIASAIAPESIGGATALRLTLRRDGRVISTLRGGDFPLRLPPDVAPLAFEIAMPALVDAAEPSFPVSALVRDPDGRSVVGLPVRFDFRAIADPGGVVRGPVFSSRTGAIDPSGRYDLRVALADFLHRERPLAVLGRALVVDVDGRRCETSARLLAGGDPAVAWVRAASTQIWGSPIEISAGWFDPALRASGPGSVSVTRQGLRVAQLALRPSAGAWHTNPFCAPMPGEYEFEIELPLENGGVVRGSQTVQVAPAPVAGADAGGSALEAPDLRELKLRRRDAGWVLSGSGRSTTPLLAVVADDETANGGWLPAFDGVFEHPLPGPIGIGQHVLLFTLFDAQPVLVAIVTPEVEPADAWDITVEPGTRPRARLRLAGESASRWFVRVARVEAEAALDWLGGSSPEASPSESVLRIAGAQRVGALPAPPPLDERAAVALFADETVTAQLVEPRDGMAEIDLSLPADGVYDLHVVADRPDGTVVTSRKRIRHRPLVFVELSPLPAVARPGDRLRAAVRLENRTDSAQSGRWTAASEGAALLGATEGDWRVAPRETLTIPIEYEVTVAAEAALSIQLEGDIRATLRRPFRVESPRAALAEGVVVRRELFRWVDERRASPDEGRPPSAEDQPPEVVREGILAPAPTGIATKDDPRGIATEETGRRPVPQRSPTVETSGRPIPQRGQTVETSGRPIPQRSGAEASVPGADEETGRRPVPQRGAEIRSSADPTDPTTDRWRREVLAEGDTLAAGELLLVVERIEGLPDIGEIAWWQDAPANFEVALEEFDELRPLGAVKSATRSARAIEVAPGVGSARLHEYVLIARRAGSCEFPPPVLERGGTAAAVRVEPGLRVRVGPTE